MSVNVTYILCSPTSRVPQGMPGWTKTNCPHCGREVWITPDDMERIRNIHGWGIFWGCSDCMIRMAGKIVVPRRQIRKNYRIA